VCERIPVLSPARDEAEMFKNFARISRIRVKRICGMSFISLEWIFNPARVGWRTQTESLPPSLSLSLSLSLFLSRRNVFLRMSSDVCAPRRLEILIFALRTGEGRTNGNACNI